MRFTGPYWKTSTGCVTEAPGDVTAFVAYRPGVSLISFALNPSRALESVVKDPAPLC